MENNFKKCEIVEPKKSLTETVVFLQLFLPKNFSRVTPLAYIFLISLFALIIGLMFVHFFLVLVVLGGFMLFVFALYAVFWKWPLL